MIWLILLGLLLLLWTPWLLQNRLKLRPRKRKSAWRKTSIPKGPDHSIDLMLRTYRAKSTAPAPPTLPKPLPEVDDWAQLQEAPSTPPKSDPVEFDEWDRLRQPESSAAPVQTQQTATAVRKLPLPEYHWLKKNHRLNIQKARQELERLREYVLTVEQENVLKVVIGTLRRTKPFVFEELLLHCFKEQGYQVMRNERYTGDDGIDGRIIRDGKLHFVQVKRYSGLIQAAHVQEFESVIQEFGAVGGFFVHTGRTGNKSRGVFRQPDSKIVLVSGMGVVNLVLGREVRTLKL